MYIIGNVQIVTSKDRTCYSLEKFIEWNFLCILRYSQILSKSDRALCIAKKKVKP